MRKDLLPLFYKQYEKAFPLSRSAHERAEGRLPLGVSSNFRAFQPFPFFLKSAVGTRLTTLEDVELVDFAMGFGALMTGHAHPAVMEAVRDQTRRGTLYTIPHELTVEVADLLAERFRQPLWRFTSSGMEAVMHALRVARFYTQRNRFIKVEGAYHGATDPLLVSTKPPRESAGDFMAPNRVPSSHGIPPSAYAESLVASWNHLPSFRTVLEAHPNEVAAILVEPVQLNQGVIPPVDGFLEGLRDLADEFGCVLIFDEVKCGAKVAYGGATERYGVQPDMICLAKSIGGGVPIGAFGGQAEIMDSVGKAGFYHAGTFSANPLAMAAARATLRDVLTRNRYPETERLCSRLCDGYRKVWSAYGTPVQIAQVGSVGMIHFLDRPLDNYRDYLESDKDAWRIYWLAMVLKGILPQPNGPEDQWTISVQHTDGDIDRHLEVLRTAVEELH
jgi:glutamate-1-semialdehyde 2,1-aminomutase